ncbi:MAG: hypothetical protein ACFBSE_21590 [Prochloraceae cyanobacterium]
MRTRKKRLNGKLEVIDPPTFTVTEICLYHPQISYQRGGMKEQFYEDGIWDSDDITSIKTVKEHIDRYARDKDESYQLLYQPFIEGKTFLRYW